MNMLDELRYQLTIARKELNTTEVRQLSSFIADLERAYGKHVEPEQAQTLAKQQLKAISKSVQEALEIGIEYTPDMDTIRFLETFVPAQLTESDIQAILTGFLKAVPLANKGMLMGMLKQHYANQYDGKLAATVAGQMFTTK